MIARNVQILEIVVMVAMFAFVLLVLACCVGCATSGMKNGVGQASFWLPDKPVLAQEVLLAWQDAYGKPTRTIDERSHFPILEEMSSEKGIISSVAGFLGLGGGMGLSGVFAGLLPAIALVLAYFRQRGKTKKVEHELETLQNPEKEDAK